MNPAISHRTQTVHASSRVQGKDLRFVIIQGESAINPLYRMLDPQTLALVQISETNHAGSVPELLVNNTAEEALFLMDGQELVGAKQNRILNTDVLVPGKTSLRIPVSCVEQSRWAYRSATFSPGKSASHRTRSAKQSRVHESLKREGRHDADQRAVWSEVDQLLCDIGSDSATRAMSDGYAGRQLELDQLRQQLDLPEDAVGLAVFEETKLQGLDLFDRHSTLKHFWSSIVDSYAIDWLGKAAQAQPPLDTPSEKDVEAVQRALARAAQGNWESFNAPGLGKDWRLADEELVGSALVWENEAVIHLQLFRAK